MKKYEGYALITGGSSGIGLAFAHELAEQGYNLVLVARNMAKLKEVATQLKKKYSVDVQIISQDLAKLDSADVIFKKLQARKIHVGLLINNAGFGSPLKLFHEDSRKNQLDLIKIMCLTLTDLTYKFLPSMLEKGSGAIILTSSMAAQFTMPHSNVYGAVKGYSLNFGINLHADYAPRGIDVLTICPAFVATNIFEASGFTAPPGVNFITAQEVAQKSLKALGKDIVLNLTGQQWDIKIGLILSHFLPFKLREMISRKMARSIFEEEKDKFI